MGDLAERAEKFISESEFTLRGDVREFARAELLRAAEIAADRHLDYEECAAKIRKLAE